MEVNLKRKLRSLYVGDLFSCLESSVTLRKTGLSEGGKIPCEELELNGLKYKIDEEMEVFPR